MPPLETERLLVRPFVAGDLADIHRILNEAFQTQVALDERRAWLDWSVLNEAHLAELRQPPYGDRAVVLKQSGRLVGAAGYVPLLAPFGQIPGFGYASDRYTTEFGLFWAVDPQEQRQGYAIEAACALVAYAFDALRLVRIVATTDYDNLASQGVMRRLGMRLLRNPHPKPEWMQVTGVLES